MAITDYTWPYADDTGVDYRQFSMTADEYAAALFLDSIDDCDKQKEA